MFTQLERPILAVTSDMSPEVTEVFALAAELSEMGYTAIKGGDEYRVYRHELEDEDVTLKALCQIVANRMRVVEVKAAHLQVIQLSDNSEMRLSLYRDNAAAVNLCEYDRYLLDHFRRIA